MIICERVTRAHKAVFEAQRRKCPWCGEPICPGLPDYMPRSASREHVRPASMGYHLNGNLLIVHRECNWRRESRYPHPCELIYLDSIHLILESNRGRSYVRDVSALEVRRGEAGLGSVRSARVSSPTSAADGKLREGRSVALHRAEGMVRRMAGLAPEKS